MRDHRYDHDAESATLIQARVAPGRQTLTGRLLGSYRMPSASTAGEMAAPVQAKAAEGGGMSPELGSLLDAAVRPDLALAAPVQLKQAVVAGDRGDGASDGGGAADLGSGGGAGMALPEALRAQMEQALGADFSGVRVREDASATTLGAEAYARGEEIVFAPGKFDPTSTAGKELIGHELVHVVQQRQGRVSATQGKGGAAINSDAGLEREADELGTRAARGESVTDGAAVASQASSGSAPGGGAAQLKPGKVKRWGVMVKLEKSGVVELSAGTAVDVEGDTIRVLSGRYHDQNGALIERDEGDFAFDPEKDEDSDQKHVVYSSCSTCFVGLPEAIDCDEKTVLVRAVVQTRNLYDRMRIKVGVRPIGVAKPIGMTGVRDEHIDEQNPQWTQGAPIGHSDYTFAEGFSGFSDGSGAPSALRNVFVRVPVERLRGFFQGPHWTDTGICLLLGLEMFYGGPGPSTATLAEKGEAYSSGGAQGHQFGFGATSTSPMLGRVTFSDSVLEKLKIGRGERMSPEQYHQEPLGENPPNSLELPFPPEYVQQHPELLPLVPTRFLERDDQDRAKLGLDKGSSEMQLKLQTRIENEATLKVSSLQGLQQIVQMLSLWAKEGGDVTSLLCGGDPLLSAFTWTLEKKKPMVFTDVYLDDKSLHALRAGLGIRKRRSKEAAKLNVKTGAGYNVKTPPKKSKLTPGQSYPEDREHGERTDIWRRHEIGFSLNPDATPQQIGAFLQSGVEGDDPWNLGAQQANLGLEEEDQVHFSELREQMVLIGDRTKFNLKAVPRSGNGVINIEISCDHTVGCRPEDWNIDPNEEGFSFSEWYERRDRQKFPETFNIEMELEHLGAGGSTESGGSSSSSSSSEKSQRGTMYALPSQIKKQNLEQAQPQLGTPMGFPDRRPYTKQDSGNEAFGTPSFSVFYAAHNQVIDQLRQHISMPKGDLGPDVQKLEAIRDKLNLLGDQFEQGEEITLSLPPRFDPSSGGGSSHQPPQGGNSSSSSNFGPSPSSPMPKPSSSNQDSNSSNSSRSNQGMNEGMNQLLERQMFEVFSLHLDLDESTSSIDSQPEQKPNSPSSQSVEVLPPSWMSLYDFNRRYKKGVGDGTGLNCLLDSICQVAYGPAQQKFGGSNRKETVEKMRQALVSAGFTKFRRMLDIADANEGQAILAELDINVVVFIEAQGAITSLHLGRSGGPLHFLHFKNEHYSPVFLK